jgi:hypothetical protein
MVLGLAGVAMTAITLALAVVLPAQLDSGKREQPLLVASQATPLASAGVAAITSITVVAAREPRSSTAPLRIVGAAPIAGDSGETVSSAIIRVSSAAR